MATRYYPPIVENVQSYSANIAWAASATRRYLVLSAGVLAETATAPTLQSQIPSFDVPDGADMFGLEIAATFISGTPPATWTTAKLEAWCAAKGSGALQIPATAAALKLDTGTKNAPIMYADACASYNRQFIDVTGGDSNWANTSFFGGAGAGLTQGRLIYNVWFSPAPPTNTHQRVCNYETLATLFSFAPVGSVTFSMNISIKPIAIFFDGGRGNR